MEALLTQLNQLFPEQMFGHKVISQDSDAITTEQGFNLSSIDIEQNVINLLQNKNGIDYSSEIEILMYESNPQNLQVQPQGSLGGFQQTRLSVMNRLHDMTASPRNVFQ